MCSPGELLFFRAKLSYIMPNLSSLALAIGPFDAEFEALNIMSTGGFSSVSFQPILCYAEMITASNNKSGGTKDWTRHWDREEGRCLDPFVHMLPSFKQTQGHIEPLPVCYLVAASNLGVGTKDRWPLCAFHTWSYLYSPNMPVPSLIWYST